MKKFKTIFTSLLAMMMVATLAGCSSTPATPSSTPETTPEATTAPEEGAVEEEKGNTILVPLFAKDPEAGTKYDTDTAQVKVNFTSDSFDVNTITALDVKALFDASACEVGKECTVEIVIEIVNDTIDPTVLTITPDVTEAVVVVTK